jgi:hypothetical protein
MLINIELCLNSSDLKIYNSNLNNELMTKRGLSAPFFTNNQTKEEHHG